jgi:hypothetical protein
MVKVFTIVKDEIDIIKEWIEYHGKLFGYKNLFIIDNFSSDGTWELLQQYTGKVNIYRKPHYKLKGKYMTYLIRTFCKNEYAFPIDIDEFIVLLNKNTNQLSCEQDDIMNYVKKLPLRYIYKMNYIFPRITNTNGYTNAFIEATYGYYENRKNHAKSFIFHPYFKGVLDHGNHCITNDYLLTDICLVHYHCRSIEQMKKKIANNVSGLGYPVNNIMGLKTLLLKHPSCPGYHHVINQINVLSNTYNIPISKVESTDISLLPLS